MAFNDTPVDFLYVMEKGERILTLPIFLLPNRLQQQIKHIQYNNRMSARQRMQAHEYVNGRSDIKELSGQSWILKSEHENNERIRLASINKDNK